MFLYAIFEYLSHLQTSALARWRHCFLVIGTVLAAAIPAFGQNYVVIHNFGASNDGSKPYAEVTIDKQGNLYGTTLDGGPLLAGTIWKISASGKYQLLHIFSNGQDLNGSYPKAGVTVDSSGNLFGLAGGGGSTGGGFLWKITSDGIFHEIQDFGIQNDGKGPSASLVFDKKGNIFGTNTWPGPNVAFGNIWELTPAGQFLNLHSFGTGTDGQAPFAGVTLDSAGNMYGTTYQGGSQNVGTVWEITAAGNYVVLHEFGVGGDGALPIGGVTVDNSGNLFGTASATTTSGSGPGVVWEISSTLGYQVIHAFGSSGDGSLPNGGVTLDSSGNLYGTASQGGGTGGGVIWTLTTDGQYSILHTFGSGNDGVMPLSSVTFDAAGNMFGTAFHGGTFGPTYGVVWELTSATLNQLTVSPTTVDGGAAATGTITLSTAAPSGGLPVTLASNNNSVSVPPTVWVPAGATSVTFPITTSIVSTSTKATITGTLGSSSLTANLTLNVALLSGMSLSPTTLVGGANSIGTVTLSRPAPSGGTVVALASSSTSASVPASVTIGQGNRSTTFTISTTPVATAVTATISASTGGITTTASLDITSDLTASLGLNITSVFSGSSSIGTVTLTKPAGANGVSVAIKSDNAAATVPASVTVAAGASQAVFVVSTTYVTSTTQANITATLNGTSQTVSLTIKPNSVSTLTLSPSTLLGGGTSTGTIGLNALAGSNGEVVTLSSSDASASVPPIAVVQGGMNSGTFTVSTYGVNSQKVVSIKATLNGVSALATLTINPPDLLSISLNPSKVAGGTSSTGTVTTTGPVGPSGLIVRLQSSNSNASVTNSVTIPFGQSSANFTITSSAVTSPTSATIAASIGATTKTAMLTLVPVGLASVTFNPTSIQSGLTSTGTVSLNGTAPSNGFVVKLVPSSTAVSIPASVTIPAGSTGARFAAKANPVSTAVDVAVAAKLALTSVSGKLTITPPALSDFSLQPDTVVGGVGSVGTVTLTGPAGSGGIVVKLASSSSFVKVPSSITVTAGQSSTTFKLSTTSVPVDSTIIISASSNGQTLQSVLTVLAPNLVSLTLSPNSVKGGQYSTATVTISSPAPVGGLTVTLAGNQTSVTVPASVTIPAGKTQASVKIKTSKVGSTTTATISASFDGTTKSAVLTIS